MSVSTLPNRSVYNGDGASTAFAFPYKFTANTDLVVYTYDPTTGTIVAPALGTDYTVSGTQDAQGIYQSGGSVNFSVAPASGIYVVIFRNPSQVQNYALLQNQTINAVAVVNQLDYLTLLIQRLQDLVNRAVLVPDGVGPTFSNQLPGNIPLQAGMSIQVNQNGNGWVLGTPFTWQSVVIPYTSFNAAAVSQAVNAFTLPKGYFLSGVIIKHSTLFAGTSITDVQMDVGVSGDSNKFVSAFDVHQAVSDSAFDYDMANYLASWANDTQIQVKATATGANLNQLTAGSVTIYYLMQKVTG